MRVTVSSFSLGLIDAACEAEPLPEPPLTDRIGATTQPLGTCSIMRSESGNRVLWHMPRSWHLSAEPSHSTPSGGLLGAYGDLC